MNLGTDNTDRDNIYLALRTRIDYLCQRIKCHEINSETALQEYRMIEEEYSMNYMNDIELFRMIYQSRISRLCGQYLSRGFDGS